MERVQAIQQYQLDGTLITCHESIRNAARAIPGATAYSIVIAAQNDYPYKGFRWLMTDRSVGDVAVPLRPVVLQNLKLNATCTIAALNLEQTAIIQTFESVRAAAIFACALNASSITLAIQRNVPCKNFYFKRYGDCAESMRTTYESQGHIVAEPLKRAGNTLIQLDAESGAEIKVFESFQVACKIFQGSHLQFHKAIKNDSVYKEFRWKMTNHPITVNTTNANTITI